MPIVTYLRKTHEVDFLDERETPLCYVDGQLSCILAAREFTKQKGIFNSKGYNFAFPDGVKTGSYAPVWFYLLFINKPYGPLYRVKAKGINLKRSISIYSSMNTKYTLELVGYLSGRGNNIMKLKRDKYGKFLKAKPTVKGGEENENITN